MLHLTYTTDTSQGLPLCFLVPVIRKDEIQREYLTPFDIPLHEVLVLGLHYAQGKKKTPAAEMKEFITSELVPTLEEMGVQYLMVADSEYFKVLTKASKVDVNLGYVLDCVFGPWKVVYVPNYRQIFYDPDKVRGKIKQAMDAVVAHATGTYENPGTDIIKFEAYPRTNKDIQAWLDKLLAMDCDLAIDIEAFSLKHHAAGIGTITFCWNKHEGIAFPVDYEEIIGATEAPFGKQGYNDEVRMMLRRFFQRYLRKALYHQINYDVYVLIYQLFMTDLLDTEGLLYGIKTMLHNWHDTKLITYLATNSCAGNKLGLKDQAQEFSGNYAEAEIKDITRIPLPQLLRYNLIDGLSTWFVYEKHYQQMIADEQEELYEGLFKSSIVDIIQMQLTGLPMDMPRVIEVNDILTDHEQKALTTIRGTNVVQQYEYKRLENFTAQKNSEWKKKRLTVAEMQLAAKTSDSIRKEITFNPNSGPQLQELLFDMLELPVLGLTDSKQPSTDGDTIRALVNHTTDPDVLAFLDAMLIYAAVNKILTSVIPAMLAAPMAPDGHHYLYGYFNLGGTVSGRLSSSDPNLQNLPSSNAKMAINKLIVKLIKSCFKAPPGWIFCGLDFAALEDKISAVTTRDPNKLKVYTDGYDGHSLRAYAYFQSDMPLIRLSQGRRSYTITQDDETYYLLEGDDVELPDGSIVKIETLVA